MQYQVPQFIEIEDKIFGPLTFKQFVYLAGSAGVVVILVTFLPLFFAIVLAAPIVVLSLLLAFYKVNDRSFIDLLEAGFSYFLSGKLYLWEKGTSKSGDQKQRNTQKVEGGLPQIPKYSESKLKDLAWSLDIKESLYGGVKDPNENNHGKQ